MPGGRDGGGTRLIAVPGSEEWAGTIPKPVSGGLSTRPLPHHLRKDHLMQCTDCARPAQARGLCNTHYSAARRAWLEDGIDLFPARVEARPIRLRPVTCRYRACVRDVYLHDVCTEHLVVTLAAGTRARRFRGQRRLTAVAWGMRAA